MRLRQNYETKSELSTNPRSDPLNKDKHTALSPGRLVRRKVDWLDETDEYSDVVLTTRMRLARNLRQYNFPARLNTRTSRAVFNIVAETLENSALQAKSAVYRISKLENITRSILLERRLIDYKPVSEKLETGIIVGRGESGYININCEDHLHFNSVSGGFNSKRALKRLHRIFHPFEQNLSFHHNWNLGYLTSSPVQLGTGFRISYYCHLPALNLINEMGRIAEKAQTAGIVITGNYNNKSDFIGANIFQLYNQATLGISEQSIIEKVETVIKEVIKSERKARQQIKDDLDPMALDRISRFLAILQNAYILDSEEMILYMSALRFGLQLGWIKGINSGEIIRQMVYGQDGHLCAAYKIPLDSIEKDKIRAAVIREALSGVQMA